MMQPSPSRVHRLSLAILAALLTGCHGGPDPVVHPGTSAMATGQIRDGVEDFRFVARSATGDTTQREFYRRHIETRVVLGTSGAAAIQVVEQILKPSYLDSLVLGRDNLVPQWETFNSRGGTTRLEYAGKVVRLTRTRPDSGPVHRSFTFPVPVFAFQELDLLVRSLPLTPGYHAILPLFSEGDNDIEMDTVSVIQRLEAPAWAGGPAWVVRFADPAIVAHYTVDSTSRRIIAYEATARRNGMRWWLAGEQTSGHGT